MTEDRTVEALDNIGACLWAITRGQPVSLDMYERVKVAREQVRTLRAAIAAMQPAMDALRAEARDIRDIADCHIAEIEALKREAIEDVLAERETCAALAEGFAPATQDMTSTEIADHCERIAEAIRARTAQEPTKKPLELLITREWLQGKIATDLDMECEAGLPLHGPVLADKPAQEPVGWVMPTVLEWFPNGIIDDSSIRSSRSDHHTVPVYAAPVQPSAEVAVLIAQTRELMADNNRLRAVLAGKPVQPSAEVEITDDMVERGSRAEAELEFGPLLVEETWGDFADGVRAALRAALTKQGE